MEYREHRPPPALRRFVQCLWSLHGDGRGAPPQRVLPDGSVELVFHLGDPFRRHLPEGLVREQPRALVVGEVTRALVIESTGTVDLMGVRFHPGMAGGVLGIPPASLLGGCHDLRDLGIAPLVALGERLGELADERARLAHLTSALHTSADRASGLPQALLSAVGRILETSGRVRIESVAHEAGVSTRHLERLFTREIGLGPKELGRLRRFQRLAARVSGETPPRWASLAVECGYHDQAHLIREFREFAGVTPGAYWRETHPLSDLFHGAVEFLQDTGEASI